MIGQEKSCNTRQEACSPTNIPRTALQVPQEMSILDRGVNELSDTVENLLKRLHPVCSEHQTLRDEDCQKDMELSELPSEIRNIRKRVCEIRLRVESHVEWLQI